MLQYELNAFYDHIHDPIKILANIDELILLN